MSCFVGVVALVINGARLRELSRRKAKVITHNVGVIVKQHSVIDLSLSHVEEEKNKKRKHDESIDHEVNSRSEPYLVLTQLSFPILDGNVSWCKAFAFEVSEGKEVMCSMWSKAFLVREILDQNFVGGGGGW